MFPNEEIHGSFGLLGAAVKLSKGEVRCFTMDQAHALWFTLPKQYYDEKHQHVDIQQGRIASRGSRLLVQKIGKGTS